MLGPGLIVLPQDLNPGEGSSLSSHAHRNLGTLLEAQGRLDAARPLCEETLAARRETLGDGHPHTLTAINNLEVLQGSRATRTWYSPWT